MYSPESSEYTIKEEVLDTEYIPSKVECTDSYEEKTNENQPRHAYEVDMDNYEENNSRLDIDLKSEVKLSAPYPSNDNYEDYVNQENEENEELDEEETRENEEFDGFNETGRPEKVMNDIFGDSDEEEDFEGFNPNEIEKETTQKPQEKTIYEDFRKQSEYKEQPKYEMEIPTQELHGRDILRCFEEVVEKQRVEKRLNRPKKRTDVEFLNEMDDRIADLMNKMRLAAVEDEELFHMGQPGIKKMQLLSVVKDMLNRSNIKEALIESKFLVVMAAWLKPLPNHILPPLDIRIVMLKALLDFPTLSSDVLRESNIGKAVMYLCKHPKETPENKKIATYLINEWSRPIFHLSSNYDGMTREERLERDKAISINRKIPDKSANVKKEMPDETATKPGDEGWIPRATVPKQSNKDYIIRPQWKYDGVKRSFDEDDDDDDEEEGRNNRGPPKKRSNKMNNNANNTANWEKTFRKIREAGKQRKMIQRASNISIQGRGMGI